jgi:hypothetical protein
MGRLAYRSVSILDVTITIPETPEGPQDNRLALLHPEHLEGFRIDGYHWFSPAHFCLIQTLANPEDRERARNIYPLGEVKALIAGLPRQLPSAQKAREDLLRALTLSFEGSLNRRSQLLDTGDAPLEVIWSTAPGTLADSNTVGRALMEVREHVRRRASDPEAIQCQHQKAEEREVVCEHRFASNGSDAERGHHRCYTGEAGRYQLLCEDCARIAPAERPLRYVCRSCFSGLRGGRRLDDLGTPELSTRASSLRFTHQSFPLPGKLHGLVPIPRQPNTWLLLDVEGRFHRLDAARGVTEPGGKLDPGMLELTKPIVLAVSPGGELAAVGEATGTRGVVVEPASGKVTLALSRGDYKVSHCQYPLAFFEHEGALRLVHGTDWNRLDVSDPRTGELLTRRELEDAPEGESPAHALDYFHSELCVSPGGTRVVDNGWVWHPVGMPRVFSLSRWLSENPWETEDGPSVHSLAFRAYYWDGPVAWLDERTVALWGDGEDDLDLAPAALIYDAETGKELRRFLGPGEGLLSVPPYLVSADPWAKTAVWDPLTGERLLHDPSFHPGAVHPASHELLSVEGETLRVIRLKDGA